MIANAIETTDLGNLPPSREPIYFPSVEKRLFGWIHYPPPGKAKRGLGLIVCNPFGYEAVCAHRSMRAIAEAVADLGIPTLRFDYQGAGDSAEIESEADQIAAWVRDVMTAVDELKRISGVERVCLLGTRLGGLLAIEAARQNSSVDTLILIEPIVEGRRYLREMRRVRLAASLNNGQTLEPVNANSDGIEVSGFPLSSATVSALDNIDLMTLDVPPAARVLIIDRMDLPSARQWCDVMSAKGMTAEYVKLPGFVEMIMTPAESATIPVAMIAKIRQWLPGAAQSLCNRSAPGRESGAIRKCATYDTVMHIPCGEDGSGESITEHAVYFGPDAILFGIVTKPKQGELRNRAVIFLNTGAAHHVGVNRSTVSLAREWARSGYLSLRMDLSGIGDSETRAGRPMNEVFPPTAIEEIREAIELVRTRHGITDITLVGTCSGATLALNAAIAGLPVKRIFLVNPVVFFWNKPVSNRDIRRISEAVKNPPAYRRGLLSAAHWKRLFTGQVRLGIIPQVFVHRLALEVEAAVRELARRFRLHLRDDIGWALESIAARGIKIVFVFAFGEPGVDLLKMGAGSSLRRIGDGCHVRIIEGGDHSFSQQAPRSSLAEILSEELFMRQSR